MLYLKLKLQGILQSYGGPESGWVDIRNTLRQPTASAVAGIIACCMGVKPNTPEYRHLLTLDYRTTTNEKATVLEDYQIIGPPRISNPFNKSEPYILGCDAGAKAQLPITKHYLQDGAKHYVHTETGNKGEQTDKCLTFYVLVGSNDTVELQSIHYALRHPVWVPYLGRACCTPSAPLIGGTFDARPLESWEGEFIICPLQ